MAWNFNYIAITNEVEQAQVLDECGVQQIMVDAENIGKAERQAGKNAVINFHQIEDVAKLKSKGIQAEIICRINGYYNGSPKEIEQVIEAGADALMIPMIENMDHFRGMVQQINGRCKIVPLIETPYSVFKINEIVDLDEIDQVHFGLNDLHLGLGMKNLFEVLLSPVFAAAAHQAKNKTHLIGIGGIGDPNVLQKVDPKLLLAEYLNLGSRSVILSRSFFARGYQSEIINESLLVFEKLLSQGFLADYQTELKLQIENL